MKKKILFLFALISISYSNSYSQASITNAAPTCTIDFSNSMQTSIGTNPSTAYTGAGFSPNPTVAGRLNSNAWQVSGWDSVTGQLPFGGTQTVDDYARGSVSSSVTVGGMYAFTDFPNTVSNPCLMIQPGASDFAPGSITLKIINNGTTNITQLAVSYNILVRNDQESSSSLTFSHSLNNVAFVQVPALDYASPTTSDAFQWGNVGLSPSRSTTITGLNIAPGGLYYIRWSSNDILVSGDRDEIGIDDIQITGYYGAPAPVINLVGNTLTILNGDTTPSVADGTNYGIQNPPISYGIPAPGNSSQTISYSIQNLGGAPLTITSINISGTNASDFYLLANSITLPTIIPPLSYVTFSITFDPNDIGTRTAFITINSNSTTNSTYTFSIQGDGYIPVPEIGMRQNTAGFVTTIVSGSTVASPINYTLFNPQNLGGSGQLQQYKILNEAVGSGTSAQLLLTGTPKVTIGGVNPSDFTVTIQPISNYINPGFSLVFEIKFLPTALGVRTAIVSIANNDSDENPYTFLVQGNGVTPEIDITGNSQPIPSGSLTTSLTNNTYFDNVNVSSGSIDRTFTIQNLGTSVLTIGAISISGVNASDFTLITPPAASIAIGATTTFVIHFDPSAIGPRNASVSIVNNDLDENPYTFAIGGYGVDYTPCSLSINQTIAIQDFETTPATPVWSYSTTGTTTIAGGTGYGVSGDSGLSSKFIGTRSLQVTNSSSTITMANVDTSTYRNVSLNLKLAAMSSLSTEGLDATDKVIVSISTDNGGSWSNELQVSGNTNSLWTYSSGVATAARIYLGNNLPTIFSPSSVPLAINYQTVNGYGTLTLSNLPITSSLTVKISISNNANEIWAIDNVTLTGQKELTTTWNGVSWNNGAPTNNIKAIIDGDYNTSINGNLYACKCEIKSGRNVTVTSNTFFHVESDLNNKGNLSIDSGGSLVQKNDFATNGGTITSSRNTTPMTLFDYTYWSSPVANQTLFNLSPNTLSSRYFNYSPIVGNWINSLSSDIMQIGKGYIIRAPQNYSTTVPSIYTGSFYGTPNNGFIQTPIVVAVDNFNLIGNPYPSAINADLFLGYPSNLSVMNGTLYLWTHNTPITNNVYTANDYAAYNLVGGVGTKANSVGLNNSIPDGKIASGQGFFVIGLTNGQATFNNSMRIDNLNLGFFKSSSAANSYQATTTQTIEKHRYWLNLYNDQGAFKQTLVGYVEGATNDIDRDFDGAVFDGDNAITIYSIANNQPLTIQGRALPFDQNDIVKLGYKSSIAGDFHIDLDNLDGLMTTQAILLEDKLLNVIQDLKQGPYTFSSDIGTFDERFQIRYLSTLSNNQFVNQNNNVQVVVKDKKISILSQNEDLENVAVYDVLGRILFEKNTINNKSLTIGNVSINEQTLIVKITLTNGVVINKKIIY